MRPSSPELAAAFADGVASRGIDVVLAGLCSTDGLYYASGALDAPGAMFTASHNPAAYNGIKLCRAGARPISLDTGLARIRDRAQAPARGAAAPDRLAARSPSRTSSPGTRPTCATSSTSPGCGRCAVVVDAGNGMGGLTTPAVLGTAAGLPALPIEVVPLYFELDGTFPNHEANPLEPANLRDLQAAVVRERADVGLAFDGDADRCFVVDERGEPVTPSAVTALVARREIAKERAAGRTPTRDPQPHHVPRGAARPSPRPAAAPSGPGSGTRSSRRRWPRSRRSSAASTPPTTTSGTSGSPTPGCSPRCTSSRRSASRTGRCRGCWPGGAVRRQRRDQLPGGGRRRGHGARRGASSADATASRSTGSTGSP